MSVVFGPFQYTMKSESKKASNGFVRQTAVCLIVSNAIGATQSHHLAIITPPSLYAADTVHTDNDKRFL